METEMMEREFLELVDEAVELSGIEGGIQGLPGFDGDQWIWTWRPVDEPKVIARLFMVVRSFHPSLDGAGFASVRVEISGSFAPPDRPRDVLTQPFYSRAWTGQVADQETPESISATLAEALRLSLLTLRERAQQYRDQLAIPTDTARVEDFPDFPDRPGGHERAKARLEELSAAKARYEAALKEIDEHQRKGKT